MTEPKEVMKRAMEVTPYQHGLYCTIGGGDPFVNIFVIRRWSEDGKKIIFMMDSHNFLFAEPDEEIQVVEVKPTCSDDLLNDILKRDIEAMMKRPSPKMKCPTCGQEMKHD